jgi:hypothetical protein
MSAQGPTSPDGGQLPAEPAPPPNEPSVQEPAPVPPSPKAMGALHQLAQRQGWEDADAVNRAVGTLLYLERLYREGAVVLVKRKRSRTRKLILSFRHDNTGTNEASQKTTS